MRSSRKREVRLSSKDIKRRTQSVDKIELRFIGTPRCGMNAIALWIMEHYQGYGFYQRKALKDLSDNYCQEEYYKRLLNKITTGKKNLVVRNKGDKLCVGFCWESLPWKLCTKTPSVYKNRINIMVLRDPSNQLASVEQVMMQKNNNLTARNYIDWRVLWMQHAKSYLKADFWDGNTLRILFDKWVADPLYRKSILDVLGKNFNKEDLDIEKRYTKSPFKSNKVLVRSREMKDSHPVRAIQRDEQLQKISQKIFG